MAGQLAWRMTKNTTKQQNTHAATSENAEAQRIKSFCGACRRRNFVGLTRLWGTRFGGVWNFQLSTGRLRSKSGRGYGGMIDGLGFL